MYKTTSLERHYKEKLITADQAAALVRPGDRVHFGLGCGQVVDTPSWPSGRTNCPR